MKTTRYQHHMSLREVAAELGCSNEHVRQLEIRALRKLRAALAAQGVEGVADLFGCEVGQLEPPQEPESW